MIELISEEKYSETMDHKVLPFLEKSRKSDSFEPECGGSIYYERYQQDQAKGSIVIVHGFSESAEKYAELIYYFFRSGYQVYISDLRGHGRSARTETDLSMIHIDRYEQYLTDLDYLVEKIVKKENSQLPLYLYGHSMGGGICAAFLAKKPDFFRKAVLSSPMIRPLTGGIPFGLAYRIAAAMCILRKGRRYAAGQHEFRADETFENSAAVSPQRYEYYYRKRCAERNFQTSGASYGWLRETAAMSKSILKKTNCQNIRTPILLFQAQHDSFVDSKAQACFADQVKNIRLIPVTEAKHEIYMSDNSILQNYLNEILSFFT